MRAEKVEIGGFVLAMIGAVLTAIFPSTLFSAGLVVFIFVMAGVIIFMESRERRRN